MAAAVWRYNPNEVYLEMVTLRRGHGGRPAGVLRLSRVEVFYGSAAGDVRLPVGYIAAEPIDAAAYVASHPDDRVAATFP